MGIEACPWPSRQQPIEPKVEPVIIPNAAEICNETSVQNCHACPKFNCGDNMVNKSNRTFYAAGRAEGVRECREATIKYADECHYKNPDGIALCIELPALLAALEGVIE
jgi:hypothetical protein